MLTGVIVILTLIVAGAFFAMSEISLASSNRVKLKVLLDEGKAAAGHILSYQEQPGMFFTTVQIGLNGVAILSGIVGDAFFSPTLSAVFSDFLPRVAAENVASLLSFLVVTSSFVLFADLMPKQVAMAWPEAVATRLIGTMRKCIFIFSPVGRMFNSLANLIFKRLGMLDMRRDGITSDDIYAVMEAGASAGVLRTQEKELIGNVIELDSRAVTSAMTAREMIVYFDLNEDEESIRRKIVEQAHSTYLVCDGNVDQVKGYVDSKELLDRVLKGQSLDLKSGLRVRAPLVLPDTLTLAEAMDQFKGKGESLAVVLNEYALVVGVISLHDIMEMLMGGNLVGQEEQIMKRDDHSWLIEGATPIDDVMSVFGIQEFPSAENYETIGGFLTYTLRRIPHRTDAVNFAGYRFEVMDIDNYKIDQVLVTCIEDKIEDKEEKEGKEEQDCGEPEPADGADKS